jgi:electron transfer flavoprotein alpha subunit
MSGVLAVLELAAGNPGAPKLHKMALEALAAAKKLGAELGLPVSAAILGSGVAPVGDAVAQYAVDKVHTLDHALLADYTPDGYTVALKQLLAATGPAYVVFPHTYQVRDFAPKLATAIGRVLASDVIALRFESATPVLVRQLFQGKINADLKFAGDGPHLLSVQAGAFRADSLEAGSAAVEAFAVELSADQIRTKPRELFRESSRAVDLTAADIIVSVGRGIREADNIGVVQELAHALGAELAASRPICDNGWLPMERQVGSSGQTVAPKMYLAIGISGAIQHLVGMKGSKTVVAINKDPEAPIFEIADYGIVGDLFEVVPALVAELKK